MADEIQHFHDTTGSNLYAVIYNDAGLIWDTTGTPAFEAYADAANWADYDTALVETPASSYRYLGTFPATIGAGDYVVVIYERAGGSPAVSDLQLAVVPVYWDGSAEVPTAADVRAMDAISMTEPAGTIATDFREMIVQTYRAIYNQNVFTSLQWKRLKDDDVSVGSTQAVSNDGTTQTVGKAT